jgi:hypothetical protein
MFICTFNDACSYHFIYDFLLILILHKSTFYSQSVICYRFTTIVAHFLHPFTTVPLLNITTHFHKTLVQSKLTNSGLVARMCIFRYLFCFKNCFLFYDWCLWKRRMQILKHWEHLLIEICWSRIVVMMMVNKYLCCLLKRFSSTFLLLQPYLTLHCCLLFKLLGVLN